jgi:hypothetical protein
MNNGTTNDNNNNLSSSKSANVVNNRSHKIIIKKTSTTITTNHSSIILTSSGVKTIVGKYNRRNNPELEKRRIHHCDFIGKLRCEQHLIDQVENDMQLPPVQSSMLIERRFHTFTLCNASA